MKHSLITLCALAALASTAVGKVPEDDLVGNEFPGLQLLPPGSKVRGISLPRYENHRVSALLMSELLEILTRSEIRFTGIRAKLYADNGEITTVLCPRADYDFSKSAVTTADSAEVDSTRFTASGAGVIFSTKTNMGILRGPVRTTVNSSAFNRKTGER